MRYIIYGAGAVGGVIGGRLFQAGRDVVLIARGAHLDAIRANGLTLESPDARDTLAIPAVAAPGELTLGANDVVVLAMKSQDTPGALSALEAAGGAECALLIAQNGVENERAALRRFARVYTTTVMLPSTHLEPGVVQANSAPMSGILDVGRYPSGADAVAEAICADLAASTFSSHPEPDVMAWKYQKLLLNLGNAIQAICGEDRFRTRANCCHGRRPRRKPALPPPASVTSVTPPTPPAAGRSSRCGPSLAPRAEAAPHGRASSAGRPRSKAITSTGKWCCLAASTACPHPRTSSFAPKRTSRHGNGSCRARSPRRTC